VCPPIEESDDDWAPGPDESLPLDLVPLLVVVIDSSTIIRIKTVVRTDDQWELFTQMRALVEQGRLAFPSHVRREVSREKHADAPGAWCGGAAKVVQHADPTENTLVEVLPTIARVVEADAEPNREPADPYVAAMAYELRARGYDVAVATDDCVDRLPIKIALTTACELLDLATWNCETFIEWVRSTMPEGA